MLQMKKQPPRSPATWKRRKQMMKTRFTHYLKKQISHSDTQYGRLSRFCRKHLIKVWMKQFKLCTPRQSWNVYVLLGALKSNHTPYTLCEIMHRSLYPTEYFANVHVTSTHLPEQEHYSDAYECPECGQRKVIYTQVQIRSADEGMTSFLTCVVCKHRWTEN